MGLGGYSGTKFLDNCTLLGAAEAGFSLFGMIYLTSQWFPQRNRRAAHYGVIFYMGALLALIVGVRRSGVARGLVLWGTRDGSGCSPSKAYWRQGAGISTSFSLIPAAGAFSQPRRKERAL